ncbi:hypothetical protein [Photobacterium carnosum]|uniref:hypothetical protein n=1 Tax=Photobacterium carnosum TaxID=2023717 RepID=UPI001E2D37B2|nr:hypothetical protein [Photobacterium carnosum]MCD9516435.1 hypothetical protein [Photobacterium carnosum]
MKALKVPGTAKRAKVVIASAEFLGNYVMGLTVRQFSDFRNDAQRLANELGDAIKLTGEKVTGEEIQLTIKPQY